jgi:transposase-like protein
LNAGTQLPPQDTLLILHFPIDFKSLSENKKQYPWPKISRCPRCQGGRVWGHGYVNRFFDEAPEGLWMNRYRCPDCGAVHTVRPDTHWRGFWASWTLILICMVRKLKKDRWLQRVDRQRQQYWWKGFRQQATRYSGILDFSEALRELVRRPIIVSTHSLEYSEMTPVLDPPYRIFAVTAARGYG